MNRALVEFRNVFKLDGQHREARRRYAEAERDRGNIREAYGQYLRLVEQYPDSETGQRALAEMALEFNDWDAARRHGAASLPSSAPTTRWCRPSTPPSPIAMRARDDDGIRKPAQRGDARRARWSRTIPT